MKQFQLVATCLFGLEKSLGEELDALGLRRLFTMDGRVLVADPNSRQRSLTAWDPQVILDERSGSTGSGGPMWRFAVAARS